MKSTVSMGKTVKEAVDKALKFLNADENEVEIEVLEEPKAGLFGFIGAKDATVRVTMVGEETESILEEAPVETIEKIEIEEMVEEVIISPKKQEKKISEEIEEVDLLEEENIVETISTEEIVEEKEVQSEDFNTQKAEKFLIDVLDKMKIKADVESKYSDHSLNLRIIDIDERDTGIIIGRHGETLDALQYLVNLVANRHSDFYIRVSLDVNNYREKRVKTLENLAHNMARKSKKFRKNMRLEPMNPYERRIIHSALQNVSQITTTSEGDEPNRRVVIKYLRKPREDKQ